ncbi:hypothetical protein O181_078019 [Austropuccinia psidii MF-1]|uniref:Integrase catalytic domain-containing protein n=1 Tax=Austropuccinia psidii MF-1 TaxID=1389203 RepID=A0A9Q3FFN9_9BASI|nr:hypothetical protein [Austropuccinia psidii MF-1]
MGHFAHDCHAKKPNSTFSPPLNNNSQFWVYYPIITPPRYMGLADLHQPKTADYYQQKTMAPVNVCFAELGDEEDLMNLFQAEVANEDNMMCREPVCDTGATHSLTYDKEALCHFRQLTNPLPLSVATKTGGRDSFVTGIGTLAFPGLNGETVLIKNIFYPSYAMATLISPASILQTGGKMYTQGDDLMFCNADQIPSLTSKFHEWWCCWFFPPCLKWSQVRNREVQHAHQIIGLKSRVGKLDRDTTNDKILTWHRMFGHCGRHRLKKFLKHRLGAGIGKHLNETVNDCADCLIAKSRRRSELLPTRHTMEPLDIVVCDLMGPFKEENINSGCWALTVQDVNSTYGECHIIKAKSDSATVLQGIITRWEVKTGRKLKTLHSDGGGKFWSKGMNNWCTMKGITHEKSLPMHHKQNRIVERYNRSVADMGQKILQGSGLGNQFLGYAFMWAAYTNNNIPNERTGKLTPSEILFGEKPQLDKTRIFGGRAYIHIPREHRHKLDDRAYEGHVVMYLQCAKGWLFYIPSTNKMIPSAWATFPETCHFTNILCKGHLYQNNNNVQPKTKMDIPFLLNNVQLGNFEKEETFTEQERTSKALARPSGKILRGYKEAMNSDEREEWTRASEYAEDGGI